METIHTHLTPLAKEAVHSEEEFLKIIAGIFEETEDAVADIENSMLNMATVADVENNNLDPSQNNHGSGGSALTGKIERKSLQAKGLQKEQDAQGSKAEELEREARLCLGCAVARGAHPDNRHVGDERP
ncbi:hypothetical protein B0H16DRAFT_1901616 [Mycena metata]|uniref:Uncharacterized protein n=1 Tax=Mycena metata TaxID=1033252 RepID=A0AAD7M9F5_9AGAR|nr:hypothetical protein B0H16DRAFT_1901616 [Mycena metata]